MKKIAPYVLFAGVSLFISCGGDSEEDMTIDCSETSLEISVVSTTDADCSVNGSFVVSASGGTGTAVFEIDGGTNQSSGRSQCLLERMRQQQPTSLDVLQV